LAHTKGVAGYPNRQRAIPRDGEASIRAESNGPPLPRPG
jgi:hypothetical protein